MFSSKYLAAILMAASLLFFGAFSQIVRAQNETADTEPINMIVAVSEADSGQPIGQARVTLQFGIPHGPHSVRKPKQVTYNAKTDAQGRCKLAGIYKGPIVLSVTAPEHQAYGQQLTLEKNNQVFVVKLKKPQPLL